jgi:hypothetical protein
MERYGKFRGDITAKPQLPNDDQGENHHMLGLKRTPPNPTSEFISNHFRNK